MLFWAMGSVILTWLAVAAILVGVGQLLQRSVGLTRVDGRLLLVSFWTGLAGSVAILQLWHLFWPIDGRVTALVACVSLVGWTIQRKPLASWWQSLNLRRPVALGSWAVLILWFANRAIGPALDYDTGMYHLNGVRWAKAFPIVVGLGNLQDTLAFNNTNLLFAAMLDIGPWAGQAHHLVNGLFLAAVATLVVYSAHRLWHAGQPTGQSHSTPSAISAHEQDSQTPPAPTLVPDLAAVLLATPMFIFLLSEQASSFSSDLAAACASWAGSWTLLSLWSTSSRDAAHRRWQIASVVLIGALAVSIKVSSLGLVLGLCAACLPALVSMAQRHSRQEALRTALLAVVCALALGAPWAIRSVLLSGYVIYPKPATAVQVDWQIPIDHTRFRELWIPEYGRSYYLGATNQEQRVAAAQASSRWAWLPAWGRHVLRTEQATVVLPAILALLALAGSLFCLVRRQPAVATLGPAWALAAAGLGVAFWFLTSPAPRYGLYLMWNLAAVAISVGLVAFCCLKPTRLKPVLILILLLPVVWLAVTYASNLQQLAQRNRGPYLRHYLGVPLFFYPAYPGSGFFPNQAVEYEPYTTRHGLTLYRPVGTSQCWGLPLPCTHMPSRDLRLRVPGEMEHGFVIDPEPAAAPR